MAAPDGDLPEAESEWVELLALTSGSLRGTVLTDFDGATEFTFPDEDAEAGDLLLVANGRTRPAGAPEGARVFFAEKGWWTFDNGGDEAALLTPSGSTGDSLRYGTGDAIDSLSGPDGEVSNPSRPVPAGASVGRLAGKVAALRPTPGEANIALADALTGGFSLAGLISKGVDGGAVFCPSRALQLDPFLWQLHWGSRRSALGSAKAAPGTCILAGAPLDGPWLQAAAAAVGSPLVLAPPGGPSPWAPGGPFSLLDPWGVVALEGRLPPLPDPLARGAVFMSPCACDAQWSLRPLTPGAATIPLRSVSEIQVIRAGKGLEHALGDFFGNATSTLAVNAYLLTASSVQAALNDAARRGVAVRVLLEPSPVGLSANTGALSAHALAAFNGSGVWAKTFNTTAPNAARDHAKYAVADGAGVLVLTENFVGAALAEESANTGFAVVLRSPSLARDILRVFDWDFVLGRDRTPPRELRTPPQTLSEAGEAVLPGAAGAALLTSPAGPESAWVELIGSARERVAIETLSADEATLGRASPIGLALLAACTRGVQVNVLLSGTFADDSGGGNLGVARNLSSAASLCAGRFEVRMDSHKNGSGGLLHAKVAVADGARFILGSHNMVASAFRANREVSLLVDDSASASLLDGILTAVFAGGALVAAGALTVDSSTLMGGRAPTTPTPAARPPAYELLIAAGTAVAIAAQAFHRTARGRHSLFRWRGHWRRAAPPAEAGKEPPPAMFEMPPPETRDLRRDEFSLRARPPESAAGGSPTPSSLLPPSAFQLLDDR